jgi:hypothetical protein
MRHFHPPIHAAIVAVTVVAGLASYQGVDKLMLARSGSQYGTAGDPGHEPSSTTSTTSTTTHHETGSTTTTTVHHEPTGSTSSTVPHEPGSSTSTTVHHEPTTPPTTRHKEPGSSTSTTIHHEPTPPPTSTPPTTTLPQLSFYCMSGFTGGQGVAKCQWSQSTGPNFGHYRLTRELVGTPRQTIFESNDRNAWYYIDFGLQAGAQYSYIIEAYDTAGNLIARGGPFHLTCCGGGGTT